MRTIAQPGRATGMIWTMAFSIILAGSFPAAYSLSYDDVFYNTYDNGTQLYLSGYINNNVSDPVSGPIPLQIGTLTGLESVYIYGDLSGPIPPEIGNLGNLTSLKLGSGLSGSIPLQLGNLTGLTDLDLSDNLLNGPLPLWLDPRLGVDLNAKIDGNSISGFVWDISVLNWRKVVRLVLSGNFQPSSLSPRLSGAIPPQLGDLTNLTYIDLSHNDLSGSIPPQLGNLTNLTYIDLSHNDLSGPIPPQLGDLASLTDLDLNNNSLSGPIPPQLGNLASLTYLWLSNNNLSGPIPPQLGDLASLTDLNLNNNSLSGSIPPQLGNLASLTYLWLFNNNLSGPIPPQLGDLASLTDLYLFNNNLSGPIPPQLGNLASLTDLYLNNNSLSGPIPPQLGDLASLTYLLLSNNNLSGPIPPDLGNLTELIHLNISGNDLSGPIPPRLGNIVGLEMLDLSNNNLSGPIPPQLGNFVNLDLSNNYLSGPVAPTLRAQYLDLSGNPLSGVFPSSLLGNGGREIDLRKTQIVLDSATKAIVCTQSQGLIYTDQGIYFSGNIGRLLLGPLPNLCLNPESNIVVAAAFLTFGCLWLLGYFGVYFILRSQFQLGSLLGGRNHKPPKVLTTLTSWVSYTWFVIGPLLPLVDLATDLFFLKGLWPAPKSSWGKWAILTSILLPFVVSGFYVARAWLLKSGWIYVVFRQDAHFVWAPSFGHKAEKVVSGEPMPPSKHPNRPCRYRARQCDRVERQAAEGHHDNDNGELAQLAALAALFLSVPVFDALSFVGRLGLNFRIGSTIYVSDGYIRGRSFLETTMRSLPQVILQTIVYMEGSSRANGVYVDASQYVPSVSLSLLSLLVQLLTFQWVAFKEQKRMLGVLHDEAGNMFADFCYNIQNNMDVSEMGL